MSTSYTPNQPEDGPDRALTAATPSGDRSVSGRSAVRETDFPDPGVEEHRPRLGDEDPKAAKNSERIVNTIFLVSIIGSIAAIVAYVAIPLDGTAESLRLSHVILGLGIGLGALGIGVAAVHWAKSLMSDVERTEERHYIGSDPETTAAAVAILEQGSTEANVARRPVLKGALTGALVLAPLPFLVALVGNLGDDWNLSQFRHTLWDEGTRLTIDPTGRPIRPEEVTLGSLFHVMPEGITEHPDYYEEKAKAVVLLIRVDPRLLNERDERRDWSYDGIVAYSKICTHVGCPVALYEQQTHHLLCPCHQSTFDVTDEAKVVFGPAKRPLPQLPITVDDEGYLVAQSDFHEPVGPSYWERLR